MAKLNVNGTSLEYIERGSGETIVFVHGSVSDYRIWEGQMDEFAKNYRVFAYSRRFHWPNEPIVEGVDYAMSQQLDDLHAFIHALDTEIIHLVGHSYGAFLCLLLAMKDPQRIRSLVLAEPPAITLFISDPPKPQQILKLLFSRPRTAITLIRFALTGLGPATKAFERDDMETGLRLFGTAVLGEDTFNQLSATQLEQIHANLIKAEFLGSGFLPVDSTAVSRIQIPTLLINGQRSPKLFHRLIDRLHELLPQSERTEISDASHISHIDNPSAYNAAVRSFIERHPQSS